MGVLQLDNAGGMTPAGGDGTSISAPYVAGVAALMKSVDPTITNWEIREELRRTAEPMNPPDNGLIEYDPGYDIYSGAGLVNAARAVQPTPDPNDTPGSVPVQIVTVPGPKKRSAPGKAKAKRFYPNGGLVPGPGGKFQLAQTKRYGAEVATGDVDLDGTDEIFVAGGPNYPGNLTIYKMDPATGAFSVWRELPQVNALVGQRIAVGNVLGGPEPELLIGQGPSSLGPRVEVWEFRPQYGYDLILRWYFEPFTTTGTYESGVFVAAGNVNGVGKEELIVGAGAFDQSTAPPGVPDLRRVAVYDLDITPIPPILTPPDPGLPDSTSGTITGFPNDPEFAPFSDTHALPGEATFMPMIADITVAAGNTNGAGGDEIIVGAGAGSSPEVRIFRLEDPFGTPVLRRVSRFHGHAPRNWQGVRVAAGDFNGDFIDEIVVSADVGNLTHVRAFKEDGTRLLTHFNAYKAKYKRGVRIAVGTFP